MSIFCCYRSRQAASREPDQETFELPTRPPRVKLPSPPLNTSRVDLASSEVTATEVPSLLHNHIHEATVDPTILEIEDSDDDELVQRAIRTKFIRRLSQKSEYKRHSQQSLGTSDEEVARRAELKRLMRKRIQEELKSEEEREEVEARTGNIEESRSEGTANVGRPRGGPRDNIEFCVLDVNEINSQDNASSSPDSVVLALPASESLPGISLHPCSYPGPGSTSGVHEDTILESHEVVKERNSLSLLPSSPQLTPIHIPSARDSESPCSWRLSYSAEQLAQYIGVPEPVEPNEIYELAEIDTQNGAIDREDGGTNQAEADLLHTQGPTTNRRLDEAIICNEWAPGEIKQNIQNDAENSESLYSGGPDDTSSNYDSPLDIWLRSQELHSTSAAPSRKTSDMVERMVSENFGSVGHRDVLDEVSTMQHDPLETRPFEPSADINADQVGALNNQPNRSQPTGGSSGAFDGRALKPTDQAQETPSSIYASSRYTTRPNSCQTAAKESHLNLVELLGGRKTVAPFLGFNRLISSSRATDIEKSDVSSYKTAPNDASALDVTTHEDRKPQRPMAQTNSDTASFRQRETELKSIEKRFGRTYLRRNNVTPMVSKFREEFNEPRSRTSIISKNSILAKIHFPVPKRTKYLAQDIRHKQQVALPLGWKPEDVVDPVGSQGQTAVLDGDVSRIRRERVNSSESTRYHETTYVDQAVHPKPKPRKGPGSTLKPPSRHEKNSSQQSDLSSTVLREWVNLMNDQDLRPQEEPKAEQHTHAIWRFRTPPASWAKWPSHTRQKRTGPAGEEDNVAPRDFALRVESNGSGTTWSTDKLGESSKRHVAPARSLSAQFSRAVKGGLNKVVPSATIRASSETYRAGKKPDGHLEYPELEILPIQGGYEDLQALERQIDTMKRGSAAVESQLAESKMDNTKLPLSARLAEEVHMIQHKVPMDGFQDDETAVQDSLIIPMTRPEQAKLAPQDISEAASRLNSSWYSY
ncbi:hypothetical protein F5Y11DRAFT_367312 [Daldinia sp. FL1419]|nr:hypothetical protein F5Y11DRAFT_367312 [Daldinia sp. FL1419]